LHLANLFLLSLLPTLAGLFAAINPTKKVQCNTD
jgi:hypothetical protein